MLISHVLLWTPTYGRSKVGRPAQTYIQKRCEDMGCNPENLPEAMNDWQKWRERVRNAADDDDDDLNQNSRESADHYSDLITKCQQRELLRSVRKMATCELEIFLKSQSFRDRQRTIKDFKFLSY